LLALYSEQVSTLLTWEDIDDFPRRGSPFESLADLGDLYQPIDMSLLFEQEDDLADEVLAAVRSQRVAVEARPRDDEPREDWLHIAKFSGDLWPKLVDDETIRLEGERLVGDEVLIRTVLSIVADRYCAREGTGWVSATRDGTALESSVAPLNDREAQVAAWLMLKLPCPPADVPISKVVEFRRNNEQQLTDLQVALEKIAGDVAESGPFADVIGAEAQDLLSKNLQDLSAQMAAIGGKPVTVVAGAAIDAAASAVGSAVGTGLGAPTAAAPAVKGLFGLVQGLIRRRKLRRGAFGYIVNAQLSDLFHSSTYR
jgi:hypothetical protein